MRYKCIGSPHCMKTFEYGHAMRAHIAACDQAQKILISKANVEKLEHDVNLEYPGIHGLHRNPLYPTAHHLDQSLRIQVNDRFKFTKNSDQPIAYIRQRKAVDSKLMDSSQIKQVLTHK